MYSFCHNYISNDDSKHYYDQIGFKQTIRIVRLSNLFTGKLSQPQTVRNNLSCHKTVSVSLYFGDKMKT